MPSVGKSLAGFQTEALRFERLIGCGGMGDVYDGLQRRLKRRVAIKVIAAHLAGDARTRNRFMHEAQIMSRLQHSHVVSCYDFEQCTGPDGEQMSLLVLEYVDGSHLGRLAGEGAPVRRILELLRQTATGLHAAHGLGIVHRDIKPENILVTRDGVAKLADFGLARAVNCLRDTQTGSVVGTAAYMAPETCQQGVNTPGSDIYAMGCALYHVLTGVPPYADVNIMAVIEQHISAPIPRLADRRPDLAVLDPLLKRCMAKDPAERLPSAEVFALEVAAAARQVSRRSCCGDRSPGAANATGPPPGVGQSTVLPGAAGAPAASTPPRRAFIAALAAVVAVIAIALAIQRGVVAHQSDQLLERVRTALDQGNTEEAQRLLRAGTARATPAGSTPVR